MVHYKLLSVQKDDLRDGLEIEQLGK